ncbi:RING/FYVE/PHD zinc finger superfamily protein [Perilla frutescens var. hirtella]|uniref:RING/FYVE/PHD zinc finger superfamily protein n=1 Tax=Perilla frutescens var. hirtella TaxID=608512 RepID=A0AAD4JN16_PERFH|nr:RING/FYVE/PHD zinc finger superfamily protein [Perilla frutescens var. frutescens]KAH6775522.1 RING/FYVE/PHD zinc finger superfamily protein [Perilla frutescens var. hirtella]KAH6836344.1 RING/FYVE/PHD zinc finger superfamily protein [Perilla frutescens var. hirtella]
MESKLNRLPPLKRFRLMQQHQQQTDEHYSKKITENSMSTPSCLPAKKRKESRDSPSPPPAPIFAAATALCLPAKKRIWAFQPFDLDLDLNLEYKPPSNDESAQTLIQADGINNEEEKNQVGEDSETREDSGADGNDDDDDDGIVCAVCESTDGDPTDPIVLCDGCDLMVHATCYGHPFTKGIPEGDWFCAQCLDSKSEKNPAPKSQPTCCLCPVSGGALKPTTDGRWAHLVCAIYVPEVFFVDSVGREGINCDRVLKKRWGKKCYVCASKNGCVIDCSEPKCELGFHVSCGFKQDLSIEYRQGKNRGAVVAAFCKPHTDLWKKQEQTGKFKIVARDEDKK